MQVRTKAYARNAQLHCATRNVICVAMENRHVAAVIA